MAFVKQIDRIVNREGRVLTVEVRAPVVEAARKMKLNGIGALVVIEPKRRITGIITERDILGKVVASGRDPSHVSVAEVMTPKVIACALDTTVARAQQIMAANAIRHLPIIEDGVLVGMISSRDILAHQLSETRAVVRQQSRILRDLEREHPGIAHIRKDHVGRVVI